MVCFPGANPEATFFFGGGAKFAKVTTHLQGGPGACLHGKFLNFESLKRHFLHFEGTFKQSIKVFNHIFNSVQCLTIFNKYFGPNEIRLSFAFHFDMA